MIDEIKEELLSRSRIEIGKELRRIRAITSIILRKHEEGGINTP